MNKTTYTTDEVQDACTDAAQLLQQMREDYPITLKGFRGTTEENIVRLLAIAEGTIKPPKKEKKDCQPPPQKNPQQPNTQQLTLPLWPPLEVPVAANPSAAPCPQAN